MTFNEFSSFKKMITPTFIQIIFWVGAAVIAIVGLYMMVRADFFLGLIYLVLGPVVWRIYCEILIVLFKIHENVEAINQKKQ
ncbi:MAG: DUF4282 domain-containing protein [Candidatus Bathyarchaeia archaeon]